MIKAFAPRLPRGCSWVLLSIVPACLLAPDAGAWAAPEKGATAKPKAKGAAPKEEMEKEADAPAPEAEPEPPKNTPTVEVFKDPRAEDALKKFKQLGKTPLPNDYKLVLEMAKGNSPSERATITKFVDGMVYELTSKPNLTALTDPPPPKGVSTKARAIQEATDKLLEPLFLAKDPKLNNTEFLKLYSEVLLDKLTPLLDNHLFARVEAMIVLAQTSNSSKAVDLFIKQLNSPTQTIWVKHWAARGLANFTQDGAREIDTFSAAKGAKALADFLDKEKTIPWPSQMRALEALGALRQVTLPSNPNKPEIAEVAMRYLADPEVRPEVRTSAALALGMMRITGGISKYNFALVAYNIGEVAADLGARAAESWDENPDLAKFWISLLLNELYPALDGKAGVSESGLLHVPANHPSIGSARNYIKQVDDVVKPVAVAALKLATGPPGLGPGAKNQDSASAKNWKELSTRVAALRLFLEKNVPADNHLVPGGVEFPPKNHQVAEAPGAKQ